MSTAHQRKKLRLIRQENRAEILDYYGKQPDSKFNVDRETGRLWVIFGGDIAVLRLQEATRGQRTKLQQRMIRKMHARNAAPRPRRAA